MKKALVLLLLLLPILSFAQTIITGKVINAGDKTPVPYASVFLSNSMVGGKTNDDGSFTLNNVKPGQYDLVISFIGFETHHQTVNADGGTINLGTITITPKTTQLKEVTIGLPDPNREGNLRIFLRDFLGHSENTSQCKLLNPDAVILNYDAAKKTLSASSDDFLVIENKALGYIVKYQLTKFTDDFSRGFLYYEGSVFFEEIKGKPSQLKNWEKKRLEVYKGSSMHFLRSIFTDQLETENFRVLKLARRPNPARLPDSLIKAKLKLFSLAAMRHPELQDSVSVWIKKQRIPKIVEYLVKTPMPLKDFVARTDNPSLLALKYTDYLYVIYTKKADPDKLARVYRTPDMATYPTSIIDLNAAYAVFGRNGIFTDPTSTTNEGEWANHGVADLLPFDYEPKQP